MELGVEIPYACPRVIVIGQAFAAFDRASESADGFARMNQCVAQPLMISLA
jgi:hypothetical protein